MKQTIAVSFLVVILSACSTTPEPITVTKVMFKTADISNGLLEPCKATQPPNREEYVNSSDQLQKTLLMNNIIALQDDIKACNEQIAKIKDVQTKFKQHIAEPTVVEKKK